MAAPRTRPSTLSNPRAARSHASPCRSPDRRCSPIPDACPPHRRAVMTRRRYWVYFLLFLLNTISYTDRVNMSVAGHSIATDFHLSPVALGYLFSSFLWAYVLVMLPGGKLIDAIGLHRVAAICATVWSLAQIGT